MTAIAHCAAAGASALETSRMRRRLSLFASLRCRQSAAACVRVRGRKCGAG